MAQFPFASFTGLVWVALVLPVMASAFLSCAHGGADIYPSPSLRPSDEGLPAAAAIVPAPKPTYVPTQADATGDAAIVPDPSTLTIRSDPWAHHAVDYVSRRSAVIVASPGGVPIVIHNDAGLLGKDACGETSLGPEGDSRLTIILPEAVRETSSRIYLVGCAPGTDTIALFNEGDLLNMYTVTVLGPD